MASMFLNILFVLTVYRGTRSMVDATCESNNNGLHLTCRDMMLGKRVKFEIELKVCRENPKMAVKVDLDALNIHIKKEGSDLKIPIPELGSSIVCSLTSNSPEELTLSVKFNVGGVVPIPVYEKTIRDDNCNAVLYWIQSRSTIVLVGIGAGVLLLLLSCCCCCWCCCCRRKNPPPTTVILQPSTFIPTGSVTVPYERQRNEVI